MTNKSKTKSQLFERLYYGLEDAAQKLGCAASDLLHFAAIEELELCLRLKEDFLGNKIQFMHPEWMIEMIGRDTLFDCKVKSDFGVLQFEGIGLGDITDITLTSIQDRGILALDIYEVRKIEEAYSSHKPLQAGAFSFPRNYKVDIYIQCRDTEKSKETREIDEDGQSSLLLHKRVSFNIEDVVITAKEMNRLSGKDEEIQEQIGQFVTNNNQLHSKERTTFHNLIAVLFEKLIQERNKNPATKISQTELIAELSKEDLQGLSQSNLDRLIPRAIKEMNENIKNG